MKRILVPLDGTKNAEAALSMLAPFCDPDDEVVLLKVERPESAQRRGFRPGDPVIAGVTGPAGGVSGVTSPDLPLYVETGDQVVQRQLDEAKDYLEGLASDLRAEGQKVAIEVLIADKPGDAIVEYARETRPAFIAMLRRTHPSVAEMIFGSVATSVMRADVAPVLFVPPPNGASSGG